MTFHEILILIDHILFIGVFAIIAYIAFTLCDIKVFCKLIYDRIRDMGSIVKTEETYFARIYDTLFKIYKKNKPDKQYYNKDKGKKKHEKNS
jgi:hypothetical protein